jgi:hypothetical protein
MRSTLALALLCLSAAALSEPPGNRFQSTILYPNPNGSQFAYHAEWADVPSQAEIRRALPKTVDGEGRTDWMCHVDLRGRLHDCEMDTSWPRDPRYENAGKKLLHRFLLAETAAKDAQRNNARVSFQIGFFGEGLKRADMSSCPPPFCVPVLPPPPPPH